MSGIVKVDVVVGSSLRVVHQDVAAASLRHHHHHHHQVTIDHSTTLLSALSMEDRVKLFSRAMVIAVCRLVIILYISTRVSRFN